MTTRFQNSPHVAHFSDGNVTKGNSKKESEYVFANSHEPDTVGALLDGGREIAGSAPQQLALAALPAINQDAVASRFDEEAGMVAFCRRNACRRP
jgi:hypothetical protein